MENKYATIITAHLEDDEFSEVFASETAAIMTSWWCWVSWTSWCFSTGYRYRFGFWLLFSVRSGRGAGGFFLRILCCFYCSESHRCPVPCPVSCFLPVSHAAYIHSNQIMGWGEKAIEIRSVETGHLDGVFMHKRAQRLKFLSERNDKVGFKWNVFFLWFCTESVT